jgi:hypothetical protein
VISVTSIFEKAAAAPGPPDLVEFCRNELDEPGKRGCGFVVGLSSEFLLVHSLGDRVDLDGYEIVRVSDVTSIHRAFLRKPFYLRALELKGTRPQVPAGIDLTDVRSLLSSIERNYPLITIHRERAAHNECEIGRLKLASESSYALRWITPQATWEDEYRIYRYADITRINFDAEYERSLALVADSAV